MPYHNLSLETRKHQPRRSIPDSLYIWSMRSVSRHLKEFDLATLTLLPVLIKSQLLRNVTRRGDGFGFFVCPQFIQALLHKNTVQLDLSSCPTLNGHDLRSIIIAAPKIRELRISQTGETFQHLGYDDLLACVQQLPELKALYLPRLDGVTDDLMFEIGENCKELEVLDVAYCANLSDACGLAVRSMALKKLNISHTKITDAFLENLKDSVFNGHAEEINLGDCEITSSGLRNLCWDKLKYIGFNGANLTDMEFVKKMGNLKFIQWTISA